MYCRIRFPFYLKHVIVFLTIFWFLPRDDYAQAKESGKSKFIKVTNLEGLRVKCILKDLYGFMWFGTASDAAGTRKAIYAMQNARWVLMVQFKRWLLIPVC